MPILLKRPPECGLDSVQARRNVRGSGKDQQQRPTIAGKRLHIVQECASRVGVVIQRMRLVNQDCQAVLGTPLFQDRSQQSLGGLRARIAYSRPEHIHAGRKLSVGESRIYSWIRERADEILI